MTPVAILAASLARIEARLEQVSDDAALLDDVRRARTLAAGLDPYVSVCTSPPSDALIALARRTREHDWGGEHAVPLEQEMLSGHVEGQLLRMLVQATGARDVLDIGMFTGYSALATAEALAPGGRVVACEVDADVASFAQECFAASSAAQRIDVRVGPAIDTLLALAYDGARFDLDFLDADKPGYADYYATLLDRDLLAPGGLLCVDNTLMQGEPWASEPPGVNGEAIAAFNQVVARDIRVEQVLLPVRDGVTLVRRVER